MTSPELAAASAAAVCERPLWSRADGERVRNPTPLAVVNAAEAMRFGGSRGEAGEPVAPERVLRDGAHAHPVPPRPPWLTPAVVSVAEGTYADRAFARLPLPAGARRDAGCEGADILARCRSGGSHVRGGGGTDLSLGKR